VDIQALKDLSFSLGVAAEVGAMRCPPFLRIKELVPGMRLITFVALNSWRTCSFRAIHIYIFKETINDLLGSNKRCRISSLGGAPGFDFIAAALLASYQSQQQRGTPPTTLHATVFDY
jgi:hypothetical protein